MKQNSKPNLGGDELFSQHAKAEMIAPLRTAVDRGITLFDTAEVYGPFSNEEFLGEGLASVREQVL